MPVAFCYDSPKGGVEVGSSGIKVVFLLISVLVAIGFGVGLAIWRAKKRPKAPRRLVETNVEAARRRAQELAAKPKPPNNPETIQPYRPNPPPQVTRPIPNPASSLPPPSLTIKPASIPNPEQDAARAKALYERPTLRQPVQSPAPSLHQPEPATTRYKFVGPRQFDAITRASLRIRYANSKGETSSRVIDVQEFAHDWDGCTIQAYCYNRGARRTFKVSRILEAIDTSTGEVISNLDSWLDAKYEASDAGAVDAFVAEHHAALVALFYVAKADGAFRAPEKRALEELCDEWGLYDPIQFDLLVKDIGRWAKPSAIAYGRALRELFLMPEEYQQQVYVAAQRMSAGKKTVSDVEKRALARMRKELELPDES